MRLLLLALVSLAAGCTTPTIYSKTVTVTKDAEGKIVQTVVTESIAQPNQVGVPVRFEHLRGIRPDEQP
jgi:hypothetical protein